jgi:hypothetical protein
MPDAAETAAPFPCTWPFCLMTFPRIADRDRHYKTIHSNSGDRPYKCFVNRCPADVKSWTTAAKLRLHNKNWHGPYHCPEPGCSRGIPNGFGSQVELDTHQNRDHSEQLSTSTNKEKLIYGTIQNMNAILTADPTTTKENLDPR